METSPLVARLGLSSDADEWERPGPTGRQRRLDLALAPLIAAAAAGSTVLAYSVGLSVGPVSPSIGEALAWSVAVAMPLAVRRRYPLAGLIAVAVVFIGMQARLVPEQQLSSICLFCALFSAGAWGRDRALTRIVRVAVVVVMFCWLAYALSSTAWAQATYGPEADGPIPPVTASLIYLTVVNVMYFAAAMAFGTMAWTQARQSALLVQRNAELAVERDANAQRAVIAERLRIARELHDVVAHHVSLMGVQAAAARRVLDHDRALSLSTLEGVEESGRIAVEEMHRLLGVLRASDQDEELAPAPGLGELRELVERTGQLGITAGLSVVGDPVDVPASLSLSAYRIVQEALTNTARHAAAQRVDVTVRYLDGELEVEVVDDGRGRSGQQGAGLGHLGMRERIAVHGGHLDVGPRPGGGYRVRARLALPARTTTATR